MLPLFLHYQKCLGIAGRDGFLYFRERLAEFVTRVREESFQRSLISHRHNSALDAAAQQVPGERSALSNIQFPPLCLRFDVREQLGQRFEFNKTANRKRQGTPIFRNRCRRCDQNLKWNLLRRKWRLDDVCDHSYPDHQTQSYPWLY